MKGWGVGCEFILFTALTRDVMNWSNDVMAIYLLACCQMHSPPKQGQRTLTYFRDLPYFLLLFSLWTIILSLT